ncbi:MAG: hypothetical protein IT376_10340 [Polyangiaceae bacterium]|nr:hypothetical protein [Polyangiaceae bacterium]
MRRGIRAAAAAAVFVAASAAGAAPARPERVRELVLELSVEEARAELGAGEASDPAVALERGRLALYVGDCDTAVAVLSAPALASDTDAASMLATARGCAEATAGAAVVEDAQAGLWVRVQDDADRALVPLLAEVAVRARESSRRDLGVELPRPLRIDLVRDLFALAAVSGLPLEAAETTGTLAVARWGRVTMLSPRATGRGYSWQDTLAHEITHLALSRATRDAAPLWLQEGLAKRSESRWRAARPFDDPRESDRTAREAFVSGRSVGVTELGPSIAMLPTPDAATTAFAEVTSFIEHWIGLHGQPAVWALLADLRGTGDPERSMVSVTGYPLAYWLARWERGVLAAPEPEGGGAPGERPRAPLDPDAVARIVRLGQLSLARGAAAHAAILLDAAIERAPREPSLRAAAARAHLEAGADDRARRSLGTRADVGGAHGSWHALEARLATDPAAAKASLELALGLDPLAEEVACEGHWTPGGPRATAPDPPAAEAPRALCLAARSAPRR